MNSATPASCRVEARWRRPGHCSPEGRRAKRARAATREASVTVPAPETIEVTTTRVACDGGGGVARPPAGLAADRPRRRARSNAATATSATCSSRAPARRTTDVGVRPGRPPAADRRLGLHLPRLPRAAAPDPQVRRAAGRRGRGLLQHGLQDGRGRQGRRRAHPRGGDLRQVRAHLPQRALPRLQGAAPAGARRPRPAVRADPRGDPRLQPALHRDGRLRGRRHHRHLRLPGARRRRAGDHRLGRQGPDAARLARASRCSTR